VVSILVSGGGGSIFLNIPDEKVKDSEWVKSDIVAHVFLLSNEGSLLQNVEEDWVDLVIDIKLS
jgi:hypothetical protein